jgi:hypothetical protein
VTLDLEYALLVLLAGHFVSDFLLQSDWMAINKSKSWYALGLHATVYCWGLLPFLLVAAPAGTWVFKFNWALIFMLVTFVCHFVTDAITSRITSKLWFVDLTFAGERWRVLSVMPDGSENSTLAPAYYVDFLPTRHWFFVVIGFDQLLHALQLGLLLRWLTL